MRMAILGTEQSWYTRDLRRAAGDRHKIDAVSFRNLAALVGPAGAQYSSCVSGAAVAKGAATADSAGAIDLHQLDAVLVRTMPPGSLEQVVFRMDVLGQLEAGGVTVVNPARAVEAAVDKFLATAKLRAAGLRVPRTAVCQMTDDALRQFAALGGDVVLKPLFGSEGRGITRLTDEALAERACKMLEQLGAVIYLQEFVPHEGADLRLLIVGNRVLGMRRRNPLDWRTNVSRGATAEPFTPDEAMIDIARRAAAAVGAPLAGVDLLPARDGNLYVIEVNAAPGWKALAACTGVDVAQWVLDYVASAVVK
jgi:RimK family alpha-L-glutamate ligase